ncbi:unknown [Parabacteroides johnsonii CAG:246]|nr:unknown [Parabacteroides johnsonii CAG:246]
MPFVAANHGDHHHQRLKDDHNQDRRNQVSSIPLGRVIESSPDHLDSLGRSKLRSHLLRQEHQHLRPVVVVQSQHGSSRSFLHGEVVKESARRLVHDENRLFTTGNTILEIVRQVEDTGHLARFHHVLSLRVISSRSHDIDLRGGVEQTDVVAAQFAMGMINDGDRNFTDQVGGVHIIVQQAVDKYASHQYEQDGIATGNRLELIMYNRYYLHIHISFFKRRDASTSLRSQSLSSNGATSAAREEGSRAAQRNSPKSRQNRNPRKANSGKSR